MATTCAIQNNFIPRGSFQLIFWNKKRLFLHVQIYRHTTQVLSKADSPTLSENKFSLKEQKSGSVVINLTIIVV